MWKRLGMLFAVAAIALVVAAPAPAQETIKIGFFAPITGPVAADGASAKQSVELAVKDINAAGGIKGKKIELIIYDDRLNPQEAVATSARSSECGLFHLRSSAGVCQSSS